MGRICWGCVALLVILATGIIIGIIYEIQHDDTRTEDSGSTEIVNPDSSTLRTCPFPSVNGGLITVSRSSCQVNTGNTVNYGSVCQYACRTGYHLTGSNTRTCGSSGSWTTRLPVCNDIDECASNPCPNESTCHDMIAGYQCTCQPGFKGKICHENINTVGGLLVVIPVVFVIVLFCLGLFIYKRYKSKNSIDFQKVPTSDERSRSINSDQEIKGFVLHEEDAETGI